MAGNGHGFSPHLANELHEQTGQQPCQQGIYLACADIQGKRVFLYPNQGFMAAYTTNNGRNERNYVELVSSVSNTGTINTNSQPRKTIQPSNCSEMNEINGLDRRYEASINQLSADISASGLLNTTVIKIEDDGEESQSLLCSEPFVSPTPPSDDSGPSQTGAALVWSTCEGKPTQLSPLLLTKDNLFQHDLRCSGTAPDPCDHLTNLNKPHPNKLLKAALLSVSSTPYQPPAENIEKDINSNFEAKCLEEGVNLAKFHGNDDDSNWRMSGTNGFDRNRMTGSSAGGGNSNLHRLTDGSGAQGQAQPQVAAAEGMILGRVGSSGSLALHEHLNTRSIVTGSVGAGPPVTASIHAPQTLSDTQRYRATYSPTGAGSSAVGPYSPLYTGGSHGTGPAYGAYYGQYTTGGMQGAIDPHIGHYSAVLQSIGNAAQSQVPRSPYPASSGLIHPFSIPASVPAQKGYGSGLLAHERDELRYKREHDSESQRRYSTGVLKDEKAHQFTFPSGFAEPFRAPVSSTLRESPSQRREHEYYNYKVPSSRDGNIRQRMSRPSDATSSFPTENPHSAFKNTDEPSAKRTKIEHTGGDVSMERQVPESVLKYPHHFMKGSIIELGNRKLKRVEDLETNDFINSADISSDLKIDSSTVVHISENETQGTSVLGFVVGEHKVQVTIEAPVEHPFFVFGKGWSSCEPSWTMKRYELECQKLVVGDRCISLTHKEVTAHAAEISKQQKQQNRLEGNSIFDNKDVKSSGSPPRPRDSPRQSPYQGQSKSPAGSANLQGQGHRSESGGHTEHCSSMGVKSEHNFSNLSNPVGLCQMTSSGHPQEHGNNSSTPS